MNHSTKVLREEAEQFNNIMRTKSKNEERKPLFIFTKHMINDMTEINASRIEGYVVKYCKIANEDDAKEIREMFQTKLKSL